MMLKRSFVGLLVLVGGVVNGADLKVSARFGEETLSGGARKIYFYSNEKLSDVSYKFEKVESWTKLTACAEQEGYFPYGTESYVQVSADTKYLVRGTTAGGNRLTYVVSPNLEDKTAPKLRAELLTEETAEQVAKEKKAAGLGEGTYARLLAFAQSNISRTVGGGGCNELSGNGGQQIGTISRNQYGLSIQGQIVPGAVLDMQGYSIRDNTGLTWSSGQHYSVVESYDPQAKTLTILHQNFLGGAANGRFVRRDTLYLETLSGTFYVKAGY